MLWYSVFLFVSILVSMGRCWQLQSSLYTVGISIQPKFCRDQYSNNNKTGRHYFHEGSSAPLLLCWYQCGRVSAILLKFDISVSVTNLGSMGMCLFLWSSCSSIGVAHQMNNYRDQFTKQNITSCQYFHQSHWWRYWSACLDVNRQSSGKCGATTIFTRAAGAPWG